MAVSAYQKALDEQRTAAGLQGASIGATAGSTIGSAIVPGIGTLIGAGVGALGGGILGSATYADDPQIVARMKELEELQRRQEMGALGLTDAERAALESELIDPMRAGRREQQLKFQQALSGQDIGAGSYFKAGQGEEQRMATQESTVRAQIETLNQKQIQADIDRINELIAGASEGSELTRQANLQSLESIAGISVDYTADMGQRAEMDAFAERETELLGKVTEGTPEESEQAQKTLSFLKDYYK